jgi:signal transduction histidine kinase
LAVWRAGAFAREWGQQAEDGFGVDLLAASHSGGVWVAGHGRLRRFKEGSWAQDYGVYPWSKGALMALLEDGHGRLWLGTYGSGLFVYGTNGAPLPLSEQGGLPGNFIRHLFEDREGNIWVGTEGYGLVRVKPRIFQSYGRQNGLSSDLILTVCEGREGELWIGTNGEGVDRFKKDQTVRHYGAESGLTNECVWSVCQDRGSTLWVGTWGGGLFRLGRDRFAPVTDRDRCGPVVCGLYEDSEDELWLAQPRNAPVVTYLSQGQPATLELPMASRDVDVRTIMEDNLKNLWIGTRGDGLFCRNRGQWTHFGGSEGLSSSVVLSLYADSRSVLWVGTLAGLDRVEGTRITSFTARDGLPSNLISFITEDSLGNLWCGSGSGIFRVSRDELDRPSRSPTGLRCYSYTQADGLPSLECSSGSEPAGCKTQDGRIWFPTVRGLAVVDPKAVPVNDQPPPVVIEALIVEGRQRETNLVGTAGARQDPPRLRIPPGRQRFEVHYTGLSFTAPEKVRFKYKLEDFEDNWVEAGTRRVASYSYVPPGRYRFRVMAANNDGVWNERGATLALRLVPQFWQTTWFRWLVAAAVILLFGALYEFRLAAERRVTRLRLRIARDLHDEVGSNLGSIALLSEVMPRTADGRSSEEVSEIRRIAVQTIESLRDIVWLLDPAGDSAGELVTRMRESARNLLAGVPFDFQASGESNAPRLPLELRRNLFPAFKEILHNIARHAHASRVEISVCLTPNRFELLVGDNGVGFDEAGVRGGNGLKNLRRRATELRGTIEIHSRSGEGTHVRLVAPLT